MRAARRTTHTSTLRRIRGRVLGVAVLLAGSLHAQSVGADVRVTGPPEAIRLEAHDAPVQEVLAALNASFGLRYRGVAGLDRRISGTYQGPLPRVVRRLLDGYDFIVTANIVTADADTDADADADSDDGSFEVIEVMVIGAAAPGEARLAPMPVAAPRTTPTDPTPQRRRRSDRSSPKH
jgi:hypothetical protein